MENVRVGKNENIDENTRAEAMASVAGLPKSVAAPSEGGPVAAPSKGGPVAVPGMGGPVAAGTLTKKSPIVTLQQLNAFKAKYGADKDLTDYMNAQAGGLKRRNTVDPNMGAKADKAFLDFVKDRNKPTPAAVPADVPVARSEVKNTPNDLRAKSKEQQARGAKLRGETSGVLGENAAKLEKEFKGSLNVADFLDSDSSTKKFAKGGAVSASTRGDGIAQRGKTRGRMC